MPALLDRFSQTQDYGDAFLHSPRLSTSGLFWTMLNGEEAIWMTAIPNGKPPYRQFYRQRKSMVQRNQRHANT
jgi:hypothetical protein